MPKFLGLVVFLVLWFVLFECAHASTTLLRRGPLIGWQKWVLWCNTHVPVARTFSVLYLVGCALSCFVLGSVLYLGLFTSLSPLALPSRTACPDFLVITCGVLFTSTTDFLNALRYATSFVG